MQKFWRVLYLPTRWYKILSLFFPPFDSWRADDFEWVSTKTQNLQSQICWKVQVDLYVENLVLWAQPFSESHWHREEAPALQQLCSSQRIHLQQLPHHLFQRFILHLVMKKVMTITLQIAIKHDMPYLYIILVFLILARWTHEHTSSLMNGVEDDSPPNLLWLSSYTGQICRGAS